jgi:hypothetical protein
MPFLHMLPDPGMNYTLNRLLLDGTPQARIKEVGAGPWACGTSLARSTSRSRLRAAICRF